MPVTPAIHAHCFLSNDAELLPHFFRHYEGGVDHFHFWDLHSRDGTRELIAARADATLHPYSIEGGSLVETQRRMFDSVWRSSKGQADWVLLLNADEHIQYPDLRAYLAQRARDGVTAVKTVGYEMVSDRTPAELDATRPLTMQVTQGCRAPALDRLAIFSPSALTATNFAPGQHHAWPEGHVVWPATSEVLLLRYQALGEGWHLDRGRHRALLVQAGDQAQGWPAHLGWSDDQHCHHVAELRQRARTVPGLGELAGRDIRGDEGTIARSGLLDADWYELHNPDIAAHQFDALTHFCEYGWREGRAPNPYFDPLFYAQGQALAPGANPLVDYILRGEREGARPSPHFDPAWYRGANELGADEGVLAHYLVHRHEGKVSPNAVFDVQAHLLAHPQARGEGIDPYLHSLMVAAPAPHTAGPVVPPQPRWEQILQTLRQGQADPAASASIDMTLFIEAIKPLIAGLPFDADWYLSANPDVAQAVADDAFASAQAHFIQHGFFEGRSGLP